MFLLIVTMFFNCAVKAFLTSDDARKLPIREWHGRRNFHVPAEAKDILVQRPFNSLWPEIRALGLYTLNTKHHVLQVPCEIHVRNSKSSAVGKEISGVDHAAETRLKMGASTHSKKEKQYSINSCTCFLEGISGEGRCKWRLLRTLRKNVVFCLAIVLMK